MHSTVWHKIIADLWLHKGRTVLVVLAIAVGLFASGSVVNTYALLSQATGDGYLATNPASAILYTAEVDERLTNETAQLTSIADAEAIRDVNGQVATGTDGHVPLRLTVRQDYDNIRINKMVSKAGSWPPGDGEILIEQSSLSLLDAGIGDYLSVSTASGGQQRLRFAGVVHNPGLAPGWMEHIVYGYTNLDTLQSLGESPQFDQLAVTVTGDALDESHIRHTVDALRRSLEWKGHDIARIAIPTPGKHIHADQMNSFLYVQAAFGLLALLLSATLVVKLITSILTGQIREIGMMKAIGASSWQIAGIYSRLVLLLGLMASVLALPPALWAGRGYANFLAGMLNVELLDYSIPLLVVLLQVGVGMLIPLVAAIGPILKGSRNSVYRAINDYGIEESGFGSSRFDAFVTRISPGLSSGSPFLLSLRNSFRQKGRLTLTLLTLALSGAVFISALNIRISIKDAVATEFDTFKYDVDIRFNRQYPRQEIQRILADLPGVSRTEYWSIDSVYLGPGNRMESVPLLALPAETELVDLPLLQGRWLESDDTNAVVVNNRFLEEEESVALGEVITFTMDGKAIDWQVVGIVGSLLSPPIIYANYETYTDLAGQRNQSNYMKVQSPQHDMEYQSRLAERLERVLGSNGFETRSVRATSSVRQVAEDHILMAADFLATMSVLILIVGGLGLMTTMSISVLERTREIGVLRAIGASSRSVYHIILMEGLVIALFSWVVALLLSIPVSMLIGDLFAWTLFKIPLKFLIEPVGIVAWLAIAVVFALAASYLPARRATHLTTREVLSYV
jgi:putative ABC transport system permease protein